MDLFDHADRRESAPAAETRRAGPLPIRRSFSLAPHLRPVSANRAAPRPGSSGTPAAGPVENDIEEVRGKVGRVIFSAADSGYTVLAVRFEGGRGEATLQVTTSVRVASGDRVVARGKWSTYKGKPQFKADMLQLAIPREAKGIAEWLRNGAVPGVGQATIRKLVDHFGDRLPDVIDDADEMAESGIGDTRARAIARAWSCNANQPELVALLHGVGLKPKQIAKVIEQYGASAKKVVEANPWEFVETVEGIGFPTADQIAKSKALNLTCSQRIQAGLAWVLSECLNRDGHCGLPPQELMAQASRMLGVPPEVIELEMPRFVDGVRTIQDDETGLVYARLLWEAECNLADDLAALARRPFGAISVEEAEEAVLRAERELGVELDRDGGQFEASVMALTNGVTIITGGPGTGKSTTQRVLVKAFTYFGKRVALGAPTGRAAKRLAETSGEDARTIHRLLEYSPIIGDFAFNAENPLSIDVVIIDEVSMVDVRLFAALLDALPPHAILVLVGDFDQLPSVGPGQVLRDLIASEMLPVARLTRVHRQAEGSGIAIAAHRINSGLSPMESGSAMRGFQAIDASDPGLLDEVVRLVRFVLPEMGFDPMRDVQVLASMRKGEVGVAALNDALKAALNPARDDDANTVLLMGRPFTVGDRVMQTRNDYTKGVYNGEVGTVIAVGQSVDEDGRRANYVTVDFSGVEARYRPDEVDDIELSYAATVHKSQGCEFPVVLFVAPRDHRRMLNRNLLYTGVTRARTECLVVGDQEVVDNAVRVADSFRRYTGLQSRLRRAMEAYAEAA